MASLKDKLQAASYLKKGCHHTKRVEHSLCVTGFDDHWNRIESCGSGRRCNSSYCDGCRRRHVLTHTGDVLRLHSELHGNDDDKARSNIRFVTVLNELCHLDIREIKDALSRAKKSLTSIRRSYDGLMFNGRFEIEAVNTQSIFKTRLCPRKAVVLRGLNGDSEVTYTRDMALVHMHSLVFLNGNDPEHVREKLSNHFPGPYRIKMDQLYDTKSVEHSIRKICGYMLKDRYQYNHVMDTDGYKDERYIRDSSLSFLIRSGMNADIGIGKCLIYSKR